MRPRSTVTRFEPRACRALRATGFAIAGVYALFAAAMLYGDALTDPGGLRGFGMIFAPTLAFAAVAWVDRAHPRVGLALVAGLGACAVGFHAAIGLGILSRTTELGPGASYGVLLLAFLPIPVFILSTVHARRRPLEAGLVMLVVGATLATARPGVGLLLAGPPMVAGAMFALSAPDTRSGRVSTASPTARRGRLRPRAH